MTISIGENLSGHKIFIRPVSTESVTVSESALRRSILIGLPESIHDAGHVLTGQSNLGNGNYVVLSSVQSFSLLTIAAWVKFYNSDNSGFGGVVSCLNGFFANRLLLGQDQQTILFQLTTATSGTTSCSYTLPDNTFGGNWHHFACTWDGSNMQIYLDGSAVGSPTPLTGTLLSGANPTRIGVGTTSGQFFMHGNVSELALYNTALTPTEISNVYNNGANTVNRSIVSYHKFGEGSGITAHDSVGTNDGTLVNSPLWSIDVHDTLPNPSIYPGFVSDSVSKLKTVIRNLVTEAVSVASSPLRIAVLNILDNSAFINDLISRQFNRTLSEIIKAGDGSGFTSGFTSGFLSVPSILRTVIPFITTQTITDAENSLRTFVPKIAAQLVSVTSQLLGARLITLTDAASIAEQKLRKVIPSITIQTATVSESPVRKPIPNIPTEGASVADSKLTVVARLISGSASVAEQIRRVVTPKTLAASMSVVDTSLRVAIPKIVTQTVSVSADSLSRLATHFRTPTDNPSVAESLLREIIPKIAAETVSIASSVAGFKVKLFQIIETIAASDFVKRTAIRPITTQTASIDDSLLRVSVPFMSDVARVVDSRLITITRKIIDSVTILEVLTRIVKPLMAIENISDTDAVSRSTVTRAISDIAHTADAAARTVIRNLSVQTAAIADSILRKPILSLSDSLTVSDPLSKVISYLRTLLDSPTIAEQLQFFKGSFITRLLSESASVSSAITRKTIPTIVTESISTVESTLKRLVGINISRQEAIRDNDSVFAQAPHNPIVQSTGAGFGWAGGGGNRLDRPIPVRFFMRDWRFPFRRRMKS